MPSLTPPPPHQDSIRPILAMWNGQVSRWMSEWTAADLGVPCPVTPSSVSPVLLTRTGPGDTDRSAGRRGPTSLLQ